MPINKPINLEEIRKTINVSSSKNNNLLIFFTIFMLYILISVLGTSDLMLLLPEKTFKMPIINFELNLIAFYILAPVMLLLLHFNNLFNYNMYLKKIDKHSKQINMETLNPSIYGYAYSLANHGSGGFLINFFLWIWTYLIPLFILIFIFTRFADYHVLWISSMHIIIVLVDVALIFLSFHYNKIHVKNVQTSIFLLSVLFRFFIFCVGIAGLLYYFIFFRPVIDKPLDTRIKIEADNHNCMGWVYNILTEGEDNNISTECFPRLVVNEAEMAKISKSALYLPRFLATEENEKDKNMTDEDKERKLILNYGTRIDLTNRNLRYANLEKCILTRANMQESQLQGANLTETHLQAVDLSDAELQDANLREAKLQSTTFICTKLQGAKLTSANMNNSTFEECNLTGASLQKAQLVEAKFTNFKGGYSSLRNADLRNANLTYADLNNIDLAGASLSNANITGTIFDNTDLTAADLSDAYFFVEIKKNMDIDSISGLPYFKETKMFGVNVSKYKKQDSNSTKKQNMILFDANGSENDADPSIANITIYPVVSDVNTLKKHTILSGKNISEKYPDLYDKNISEKYPDLFDKNIPKQYTVAFDTHVSKKYLFVLDTNITKDYPMFHERGIIYLNNVIQIINDKNESKDKLKKLENILTTFCCSEHFKNEDKDLNEICKPYKD